MKLKCREKNNMIREATILGDICGNCINMSYARFCFKKQKICYEIVFKCKNFTGNNLDKYL